jgi:proline iminopeptidase
MRVQVNGQRMFVDVDGAQLVPDGPTMRERPVVLLLHGGPGFDHSMFKPAYSRLTDVAQVIYVDHSGQGRSDPLEPTDWRIDRWADDIEGLCEALAVDHPTILGWSFGGMVAMAHASRYPDRPAKLVLQSTAARLEPDRIEKTFARLGGPEAGVAARQHWEAPTDESMGAYMRLCRPLYSPTPISPDVFTRGVLQPELLSGGWKEALTFDLRPSLGAIRCPTLVLVGTEDPITPPEAAEEIVAGIPDATLEVFEGGGHFLQGDDPERFFSSVLAFVI